MLCEYGRNCRRRHRGGRILFDYDEGSIDIRVSFFYITIYGEKIVSPLLKQKKELLDIHTIGMVPNMLTRFLEDAVYQPSGVLLVRLSNMACRKLGIGLEKDPSLILSATEEAHQLNLSEIDIAELEILLEDTAVLAG